MFICHNAFMTLVRLEMFRYYHFLKRMCIMLLDVVLYKCKLG